MERPIRRDDGLDPLDGSAVGPADLALFAEDLRTAFPETPLPERMAEDHITAMIGAIQLLAEKGESALEPTSNAHGPDRRASGLPKLRRRTMKQKMILRLTVTAGMLVSLAGLANAGVLPGPIQGAVGHVLGIDENDVDEGDQGNLDDGAVDDVDVGTQGDVEDGDQVNTDDHAQGDVDEGDQGNADDDAQGETEDGAEEDADEGDRGNLDDDAQGDTDDGAEEDADDGAEEDADDGAEEDADDGGASQNDDGEADDSGSDDDNGGEGSDE